MLEQFKAVIAEYETLHARIVDVTLESMKQVFLSVFEKYPNLIEIGWTQYAPHFNDGEPCEFSYHGMGTLSKEQVGTENENHDLDWADSYWHEGIEHDALTSTCLYPELDELDTLLRNIPESVLIALFGHDCRVRVTRENGIEALDYDHD